MKNVTLVNLYHLLAIADGVVNEKEVALANKIMQIEGVDKTFFEQHLQELSTQTFEKIYSDTLQQLSKLSNALKLKYVAWTCVLANADGFMDRKEWQFIYKLYNKDLKLDLNDVMAEQKRLKKIEKYF